MEKKSKKRFFIVLGMVIGLIIMGVIVILLIPVQGTLQSTVATIHFPLQGSAVTLGEPLEVQTSARNDEEGLSVVELWHVKEGVFTLIGKTILDESDNLVSLSYGWLPSTPGSQKLMVRSITASGNIGEAAVELMVVDPEDDQSIADDSEGGFSLPEGGYGGDPSDGGGSEQEFDPLPDLDEAVDYELFFGTAFFPIIWDLFIPDLDLVDVEIEALSFEVQEIYDGVYCYVALEGYPPTRAPDIGYFDTSDQAHWNIEEYLGGNNAVVLPILLDQPLDIHMECEGVKDNNQTVSLGIMDATHPSEDWNGQIFQAFGSGGEGFSVTYRINPVISDLTAPTQLHIVEMNQQNYFHWLWQGTVEDIDGFRIYRDGILVANLAADSLLYPVPQIWMEPLCGEEYEYYITAYRGPEESGPSNSLVFQGAACDFDNDIISINSTSICGGTVNKLLVKYRRGLPPGKAEISVQAYKDGEMLPDFFSAHPPILFGFGTAILPLVYQGEEMVTSDQLAVTMVNKQGQVFYDEFFDLAIDWVPGTPDLAISSVNIDLEENNMQVKVSNLGCGLSLPTDLVVVREADGWSGFLSVPQISPKSTVIVEMDLEQGDETLWRREIDLEIDPLDNIPESNENNNTYKIGTARVESIQFYQVDVHNDHDKYTKGEWTLIFRVSRFHLGVWEVPQSYISPEKKWGEGMHDISTSFNLNLADGDSLLIAVDGYETDPISAKSGTVGAVVVYFSPDGYPIPEVEVLEIATYNFAQQFSHQGSWKPGGSYALTSDKGDFTIYFTLVLDR